MNKETAKKWAEIFQEIADGKEIETLRSDDVSWIGKTNLNYFELDHPEWYRVKLEPEYIPFEWLDWNQFMGQKVRRKGENFKEEHWIVFGATEKVILIAENLKDPTELWEEKLFSSMLEEWEFIDGKPFGKIK